MKRVQAGDRDAFAVLVHRHIDSLYSYAMRLTHTPANAEDLVQDTWLSAWQHAARYQAKKAKLTTWLHTILYNKFVDTMRKQPPKNNIDDIDMPDQPDAQEPPFLSDENLARLHTLINTLPLNQRSAVVLSHLQGFSNSEVAEIMGASVRAIESLLVRARQSLKNQYCQEIQES
jgi:RNA polymerase sigma-70 factor, ECF subfamily